MPDPRPPAAGSRLGPWFGSWRGWRLRRSGGVEARTYRRGRVSTIRASLAGAQEGFVFLAGDSHAELIGEPALGGRAAVNGGIGGATAPVYAAELERLRFPARAALAVLFIGSNDIAAIHAPLSAAGLARFERGARAILDGLRGRAAATWVAALPPICPTPVYPQVVEALPVYNGLLRTVAEAAGCPLIDPFARLREPDGALAIPGVTRDGVHLVDYRPVADALAARLGATGEAAQDAACAPRAHRL